VAHPPEHVEVRHQQLAAPRRAVGAQAQAVEGHAEDGLGSPVLGQAGGDVGVVVLDADRRQVEVGGELGRQVLRVQVVGHHLGGHAGERAQVVDRLQERPVGGKVLEVADVVAGHHRVALGHRHRALQLGPHRQHVPARRGGQPDRLRRVPP
jgi:hypothetical protein